MNKLVHWEIPSTDPAKSSRFYAGLFGWKIQESPGEYVLFDVEDGVGGGFNKVEKMPESGIEVYIGVDDIPTVLKRAGELGARTLQPKTGIGGGMGYWAAFADPCGCRIGIWSKT